MSPPSERDDALHAERWPGEQHGLTRRESEVLGLAANGLTNRQIADELYVNIETVKSHLKHAYHRLGVNDRLIAAARLHTAPIEPPVIEDDTAASGRPCSSAAFLAAVRRLVGGLRSALLACWRRLLAELRTRRR